MHPADIKAALEKKNSSMSTVARDLRLSNSTIRLVVYGFGKSRRVAAHISKVVGIPVSQLWPGVYAERAARRKAA